MERSRGRKRTGSDRPAADTEGHARGPAEKGGEPAGEVIRLTHELQVHQEELDIQNRQLIESQRLLEESRDRLASLFDFAPVPYVTLCDHGVIREINLTAATLFEHPRDRLVDRPLVLFVAKPYQRSFLSHLAHCRKATTGSCRIEIVIRTRSGREVPVELITSENRFDGGSRGRHLSVLVDLTDRRRFEQERQRLRESSASERLLRTVLEVLPAAVRVVGPRGESLVFNGACRSIWGIEPDAILPPWNDQKGWELRTKRRLLAEEWPVARAMRGEEVLRQTLSIQGFDGTMRVVVQSAVPLLNEAAVIHGAVEVTEDVTQLVTAQDAAHRRQEQLEAAFDAAHLSFWDWELGSNQLTWSGPVEQLFKPDGKRAAAGDFLEYIHADDAPELRAAVMEASRRRTSIETRFRVMWPDRGVRWLSAKGRFTYQNGKPVRMTGVVMDVTARKQVEDELRVAKETAEEASRLKDEFLAIVGHELRTPLAAILLWTHLARNAARSRDEAEEATALDVIERSARAQSQIVNDLLDTSRSIAGKLHLTLLPARIEAAVYAAVEAVRPSAEARQIRIAVACADSLPALRIDAGRIQQVAWNLISNAIKFTPAEGAVSVSLDYRKAEDGGGVVSLTVSDTGYGIPTDFLPHVFDRFRQADASTTRSAEGLGLGLAISKELVQLHGGTIRAQSAGRGHGSTFTVELPVPPETPAALTGLTGSSEEAFSEPLGGVRVLLVEDEAGLRRGLVRVLEAAGASVTSAASAADAIKLFHQSGPPDVLVSDITMPGQDGFSLLRRIRVLERAVVRRARANGKSKAIPAPRRMPAVALTAQARPEDRAAALKAGFAAHLAKPVSAADLVRAVAACRGGKSS